MKGEEKVEPTEFQNCITQKHINLFCLASQRVKENRQLQFQTSLKGAFRIDYNTSSCFKHSSPNKQEEGNTAVSRGQDV